MVLHWPLSAKAWIDPRGDYRDEAQKRDAFAVRLIRQMSANPFDQACRYLAKLDPIAFIAWLLGIPATQFAFRRWLDTRLLRFPASRTELATQWHFSKICCAATFPGRW